MQFKQILGQESAKESVLKAAKENRLPHALILSGPPGVGNLAFGNAIAQFVNCKSPSETDSCGRCVSCIKISKGIHPDVRFILPIFSKTQGGKRWTTDDFFDGFREKFFANPYFSYNDWLKVLNAENKQLAIHITEIRELKQKLMLRAFEAEYKVVLIWNAEKILTAASNALLKLLEEPPEKTLIILTTSDPGQLLNTIQSRCQRILLKRASESQVQDYLVKEKGIEGHQAHQVAQLAEGRVSRAMELVGKTEKPITQLYKDWLRECYKGNHKNIVSFTDQIIKENREFQKLFLSYALQKLRDTLLLSFNLDQMALIEEDEKKFHRDFSKVMVPQKASEISNLIEKSIYYLSRNANAQMVFIVLSTRIHTLLMRNA